MAGEKKKLTELMPKGTLPMFVRTVGAPGYMSAKEFVKAFKRKAMLYSVPDAQRAQNLLSFCDDDVVDWVMDQPDFEKTLKKWDEFETMFVTQYENSGANDALRTQFHALMYGKYEKAVDYAARYLRLAKQVGEFDESISVDNATYVPQFLRSLGQQAKLQDELVRLRRTVPDRFTTLTQATEELVKVSNELIELGMIADPGVAAVTIGGGVHRNNDFGSGTGNGNRVYTNNSRGSGGSGSGSTYQEGIQCNFCKKMGHYKGDCFRNPLSANYRPPPGGANGSVSQPGTTTSAAVVTKPSVGEAHSVTCYHCKGVGHTRPQCAAWKALPQAEKDRIFAEGKKTTSTAVVKNNRVAVNEPEDDYVVHNFKTVKEKDSLAIGATGVADLVSVTSQGDEGQGPKIDYDEYQPVGANADDLSLLITLALGEVGNLAFRCLVDTGANRSLIDWRYLEQIGIEMGQLVPVRGMINLGYEGQSIPRSGLTPPIKVRYRNRTFMHQFEVTALPEDMVVYVGMDLLGPLGISIRGLSSAPPTEVTDVMSELSESRRLLEEQNEKFGDDEEAIVVSQQEAEVVAAINEGIHTELEKNAELDPKIPCTHPMAVVYLNLGEGEKAVPVNIRQYPIAQSVLKASDEELDSWIEKEFMGPMLGPTVWNHPYIVIKKRDDEGNLLSVRVCLDVRKLNELLDTTDNFPVPLIEDILAAVAGKMYISVIDIKSFFQQFPLYEPHQKIAVISYKGRQWKMLRGFFGVKHLPAHAQRLMSVILGDLTFVLVYIDDILVLSDTLEEHIGHINIVLQRLTAEHLLVNVKKLRLGCKELRILGRIVSASGIRIDPAKVAEVAKIPYPTTSTQMQSFLGFLGYHRKQIPYFADITACLSRMNSESHFVLDTEQKAAVDLLKQVLVEAPFLVHPDWTKKFYLATDASTVGVGAVLYQLADEEADVAGGDNKRFIAFHSRALKTSERNYPATKLELLAIIDGLKKFRPYLLGRRFQCLTDHKALTYMFTQKRSNAMLDTWLDLLLEFDMEVVHLSGPLNVLPDALSRLYESYYRATPVEAGRDQAVRLRRTHAVDPDMEMGEEFAGDIDTAAEVADRKAAFDKIHELGHFGVKTTVYKLKQEGVVWPGMIADIIQWTRECIPCCRHNVARGGFHFVRSYNAMYPMDQVCVDLAGPLTKTIRGNEWLLVLIDVCTGYVWLRGLQNKEASSIAASIFLIFIEFGFPKVLGSDGAGEHTGDIMKAFVELGNMDHRVITGYHPQGNSMNERYVGIAKKTIAKMLESDEGNWDAVCPVVQYAMNSRVASKIGSQPFQVMFARDMQLFRDYSMENMDEQVELVPAQVEERLRLMHDVVFPGLHLRREGANEKSALYFAKKNKLVEQYKKGQWVWVRDPLPKGKKAFADIWEGPYEVERYTRGGSYLLRDENGEGLPRAYAPNQMKRYHGKGGQGHRFRVAEILDDKIVTLEGSTQKEKRYLIRWQGYGPSEDSWEPLENIDSEVIRMYTSRKAAVGKSIPLTPSKNLRGNDVGKKDNNNNNKTNNNDNSNNNNNNVSSKAVENIYKKTYNNSRKK